MITANKFSSIGPIYYEYGSLVIVYNNAEDGTRAYYALQEASHEDKHLLGKLTKTSHEPLAASFPRLPAVKLNA